MAHTVEQAGCIVFEGNNVALRRTVDGHWVFPKGHIEGGESAKAAAVREVAEETGLQVGIVCPIGDETFYLHGEERHVVYFLATVVGHLLSFSQHHGQDTFLVPAEQVEQVLSFANSRALWLRARDLEKERQL